MLGELSYFSVEMQSVYSTVPVGKLGDLHLSIEYWFESKSKNETGIRTLFVLSVLHFS